MRVLLTNSIAGTTGMPLKSGSIEHIQLAYTEVVAELGKALAGTSYSPSTIYLLNGLVNSGTGNDYDISSGSVFYNGQVYLVDAAAFTVTPPQTAVATIVTTSFAGANADLVQFTDGILRAVHQINKVQISAGLVGNPGVIGAYSSFVDRDKVLKGAIGQMVIFNWALYGGSYSDYFDGTGLGSHPYTDGWAVCNGDHQTDDMGAFFPVGYKATDPDYDSPFTDVGGGKTVTLLTTNLPAAAGVTYKRSLFLTASNNGGNASNYLNEIAPPPLVSTRVGMSALNGGQADTDNKLAYFNDTATIGGSGTSFDKRPTFKTVLWVQRIR